MLRFKMSTQSIAQKLVVKPGIELGTFHMSRGCSTSVFDFFTAQEKSSLEKVQQDNTVNMTVTFLETFGDRMFNLLEVYFMTKKPFANLIP